MGALGGDGVEHFSAVMKLECFKKELTTREVIELVYDSHDLVGAVSRKRTQRGVGDLIDLHQLIEAKSPRLGRGLLGLTRFNIAPVQGVERTVRVAHARQRVATGGQLVREAHSEEVHQRG